MSERYDTSSTGSAGTPGSPTSTRTARGFFHPVATCAIGLVLDERCRVLGFDNLHVVDASAIPTIPQANTNLTTIALAERAAEWL